jgi:hypothetical protein
MMKKILSAGFLLCFSLLGFAQSIDDIKDYIGKNQFDKAKDAIDKYMAVEKNAKKAEGWYYKGYIYNALSKDEKYAALSADPKTEAFNAFKKCYELDNKNIMLLGENFVSFFDLYNGFFDLGAKHFNAKNYADAFTSFRNAENIQQYIYKNDFSYNNFKFSALDTSLVLNTAVAARNAKKIDEAVIYYQKLAEAGLAGPDNLEMYQFLVNYYMDKKDEANTQKYLALGRNLYPENDYWIEVELDRVPEGDKAALFAKYDEVIAKYPNKYVLYYNYSVEMYNMLYTGDNKPANAEEMRGKLGAMLKKASELKPGSGDADLLMARHLYNWSYDLSDEIKRNKGTKPEDQKKRTELRNQLNQKLDQAIPFAEAAIKHYEAMPKLKAIDKANFKTAADILLQIYEQKKDDAKIKYYTDKVNAISKM